MALLCITALGVSFFGGLKLTRQDMHETLDRFLSTGNMFDFRIVSPDGVTKEDYDRLSRDIGSGELNFLSEVEAEKSVDVIVSTKDGNKTVKLAEVPEMMNLPRIRTGKYDPKTAGAGEAVSVMGDAKLFPSGDETFTLSDQNKEELKYVFSDHETENRTFYVTATVDSPLYIGLDRGTTQLGSGTLDGFAYVPEGTFDMPVYSGIWLGLENPAKNMREYDRAVRKYKERLEDYMDDTFGAGKYTVLTRNENTGYVRFKNDTSIVSEIANIFPAFFALIVILVCVTSMLRLVTEERSQIGVQKALGVSGVKITGKYLQYSMSAVLLGWCIGNAAGALALPQIFWKAYGTLYDFSPLVYHADIQVTVLTLSAAVAIPAVSTSLICFKIMRENPAHLLRPLPPRRGKRILLERVRIVWKRMTFLEKSVWRNLFRYKLRLTMMIVGVGGCTALLLTGFGLRDSMIPVTKNQYDVIQTYDLEAGLSAQAAGSDESIEKILPDSVEEGDFTVVAKKTGTVEIFNRGNYKKTFFEKISGIGKKTEEKADRVSFVSGDDRQIAEFFHMYEPESTGLFSKKSEGRRILPDQIKEGIGVDRVTAHRLDLHTGDQVKLTAGKKEAVFTVAYIFENYIGSYVFIGEGEYSRLFGEEKADTVWIKARSDVAKLTEELLASDDFTAVSEYAKQRGQVDRSLACLDYIVVLVAFFAGALAFVVIYNLTVIHMAERTREIATVQVLGFYPKEVRAYILRENIYTTMAAGLFGLAAGMIVHGYVMSRLVIEGLSFPVRISAWSYLVSWLCTLLFAVIANFLMAKKMTRIPMAESLKAVE